MSTKNNKQITIATICARAGSKGVKSKNIIKINDKPLIQYTIECAESCNAIDFYIVSTDSLEFKKIIDDLPILQTKRICFDYLRPFELAQDSTPKILTIRHAINKIYDELEITPYIIVDLDVGCPLRNSDDVSNSISVLKSSDEYTTLTTVYESERNPYFNMLEDKGNRKFELPIIPNKIITRRQDTPKVYSVSPAAMLWKYDHLDVTHLAEGNWGIYEIPRERAIDIDTYFDLDLVKFIISKQ